MSGPAIFQLSRTFCWSQSSITYHDLPDSVIPSEAFDSPIDAAIGQLPPGACAAVRSDERKIQLDSFRDIRRAKRNHRGAASRRG